MRNFGFDNDRAGISPANIAGVRPNLEPAAGTGVTDAAAT